MELLGLNPIPYSNVCYLSDRPPDRFPDRTHSVHYSTGDTLKPTIHHTLSSS